mgnify:FL=1
MIKYNNKEQIKKYLLMSSLVTFIKKYNVIHFIGNELEGCELKVSDDVFTEILLACKLLDINHIM